MKPTAAGLLLLAAWIAAIAAAGLFAARHLAVASDLRLFLPTAGTADQRWLLDTLGEGPAARVLVVALSGAAPDKLGRLAGRCLGAPRRRRVRGRRERRERFG